MRVIDNKIMTFTWDDGHFDWLTITAHHAVLYLLHRAYSHLEVQGCQVRITFFDFLTAFNTIIPARLKEKLSSMEVPSFMIIWILDYLRDRPQYVRLASSVSDTVVCNTGAPQGTVLAPYLFTLYTADFTYNTETCHVQKYSDDTAVVARVKGGQEGSTGAWLRSFVNGVRGMDSS